MSPVSIRINPEGLSKPQGYSHLALARGVHIAIAGQVALDEHGNTVGVGDLGVQAERVFANVEIALEAVGATFESIVHLTIYCVASIRPEELALLRDPLRTRIGKSGPPPTTLLFVSRLANPDWLIEAQVNAAIEEYRF
jgi:enamine deaminase RidA (YjgF/YER057c/UK114 family)